MKKTQAKKPRAALAACASSVAVAALLHPFDLVKTRLQVANSVPNAFPYERSWQVLSAVSRTEGVRGLYRGFTGTVIATGASWAIFRYLFDSAQALRQQSGQADFLRGGAAAFGATLLVHPLWLIKTKLELQSVEALKAQIRPYRNWPDCAASIARHEGLRGLYRGLPAALALVPHAAIQMTLYEKLKNRSENPSAVEPFVWGAASKVAAALTTYPLQVIRARLQVGDRRLRLSEVLRSIAREHSPRRALYRGLITHLQRSAVQSGLLFWGYELLLQVR